MMIAGTKHNQEYGTDIADIKKGYLCALHPKGNIFVVMLGLREM